MSHTRKIISHSPHLCRHDRVFCCKSIEIDLCKILIRLFRMKGRSGSVLSCKPDAQHCSAVYRISDIIINMLCRYYSDAQLCSAIHMFLYTWGLTISHLRCFARRHPRLTWWSALPTCRSAPIMTVRIKLCPAIPVRCTDIPRNVLKSRGERHGADVMPGIWHSTRQFRTFAGMYLHVSVQHSGIAFVRIYKKTDAYHYASEFRLIPNHLESPPWVLILK